MVSLDLVRMKRLLAVDPVSMTATLEPGLRGPEAEALLAEHGLTLGHYPQSFEYATIGGFAATRSSGQSCAGLRPLRRPGRRPRGRHAGGRASTSGIAPGQRRRPRPAPAVPRLRGRVRRDHLGDRAGAGRCPRAKVYEGWRWPSFAAGADAMRTLAQAGLLPTVLRLSDESETAINLADPDAIGGESAGGCLMIAGYEGTPAAVDRPACRGDGGARPGLGGTPAGEEPGRAWVAGRFDAPYLRDSMLDVGVLVETLETATYWSRLRAGVRRGVGRAARRRSGESAIVLCHVSHVYETGASLYFTVAAAEGDDPLGRWLGAKAAAMDAIVAAGATITHHHAVGTDHQPWLEAEIGAVGIAVLRAVKAAVDPTGILNPGVLVP